MLDEMSVAEYLASNPDFFSQHTELLANMYVPAQNGAGTISLVERQQQAQRDKIRQLEANYSNLLRIGNQNDAISEKLHLFTLKLFSFENTQACIDSVQNSMQNDFNVDTCQIFLQTTSEAEQANEKHTKITSWVASLSEPYCGSSPIDEVREQLSTELLSFACIPLKTERQIGLLVLASKDVERFYAGMGTMFIKRIGELLSLALSRCAN